MRLPLQGIKQISFDWTKDWYCTVKVTLEKDTGATLVVLDDSSRSDRNSSFTQDFGNEEYASVLITNSTNGQSSGLLQIKNFVAS